MSKATQQVTADRAGPLISRHYQRQTKDASPGRWDGEPGWESGLAWPKGELWLESL